MPAQSAASTAWLTFYYYARAIFSALWIAAALVVVDNWAAAAILLALYPAWDAVANLIDARRSGGLRANPTQALNVLVSAVMTCVVLVAVMRDIYPVLLSFGVWAVLSGLLQLLTALRRRRMQGAQLAMILSGAQSILAGGYMVSQALGTGSPTILDIVPYVAFGAFYFLVSAIWLTISAYRRSRQTVESASR